MPRRARGRSNLRAQLLGASIVVVLFAGVVFDLERSPSARSGTTTTTATTAPPRTSVPPTTTTTVDVGSLPQTRALPTTASEALHRRLQAYLDSIATGRLHPGLGAFFPLGAYLQTKSGGGNDADWHDRLVAHFQDDLATLHERLDPSGRPLTFVTASTPGGATWVTPGIEENKGPYWRTYDAQVRYQFGSSGAVHTTTVLCMISWRGAWYIVHVLSFA